MLSHWAAVSCLRSIRDSSSALTSSASVSGMRPTLRRVKRVRESNSGVSGASYQITWTVLESAVKSSIAASVSFVLLAEPRLDALERLVHVEVVDVLEAGRLGGGVEVRRAAGPGFVGHRVAGARPWACGA